MQDEKEKLNNGFPSELRMDMVSKDWVVIAKGRAKRPEAFKNEKAARKEAPKKNCPFCDLSSQEPPTLIFDNGKKVEFKGEIPKNWTTMTFQNKYPAFVRAESLDDRFAGPLYKVMNAAGFHEVVVTRDHKKHLAHFEKEQTKELFDVYQQRFLDMKDERFVNYISIFHNFGSSAGASIAHPHSQIVTTPLIDSDLRGALNNAKSYLKNKKKCIYCEMNEWEKESKERIVYENEEFLAVCPFASKTAFEVIISPKKHLPYFEKIMEEEKWQLADIFGAVIKKIYKGLQDPDYNFYLHTAPCDGESYEYYHWHWTILPKTSISAGFEIGTRMEISTIEPEKAAEYLRKQ